ncbi:MAG: CHAT domain-containing protein [Acidobacteriota bacterium]
MGSDAAKPQAERPAHAEPVDLEIQVTTPWGGGAQRIEYLLDSPSGRVDFHKEKVPGPTIRSPEAFQAQLFEQLEGLQQRRDVDQDVLLGAELERELLTLGHELYQKLFPRDLRRIYREIRGQIQTLVVTSDEPWIPWEIVRPHETTGDDFVDDFLCMRFRMTRWLSGTRAMAPGKSIERLLGVHAGDDLPSIELELQMLEQSVGTHSTADAQLLRSGSFRDVLDEIESGDYDLIHFAGHGEHDAERPGESKVHLDDRVFRARHLTPQAQARLKARRPVVFFNSCQVARGGSALTQLDGWAVTWVKRCGCSAFLAPLWSIEDASALAFATSFYRELLAGRPLGEAVHAARHALRAERPDSLGWLAYSVYGNPNASIRFDGAKPVERPPLPHPPTPPAHTWPREGPSGPRPPHPATTRRRPGRRVTTPPGKPTSPRWWSRHRWLFGTAVSLTLSVLVIAGLDWRTSDPVDTTETDTEQPATEPETDTVSADDQRIDRKPAPTPRVERVKPSPPPPPPPPTGPPLQALVGGRVGIVVVDGAGRADSGVAGAVEALLFEVDGASPWLVPSREASHGISLAQGGLGALPTEGRTPWGAESLLVATVDRQRLPQNNPNLYGVKMTMRTKLLDLRARAVERAVRETHTGMGPSESAALEQATERCLADLLPLLP